MQHFWSLEDVKLQNVWVTIGSFDGIHRGHQSIVENLVAGARSHGSLSAVITFYPHPAVVLGKRQIAFYLTTPEERAALLGEIGVDFVITHPFTKSLAQSTARSFMLYLKEQLGLRHLYVGHDFALGRDRQGDVPTLSRLGKELGYSVHTFPPIQMNGEVVSSSQIRAALSMGDIQKAHRLLGRPYRLSGEVVGGDGRGRSLGIPTANLAVWAERALPKAGVYVCLVTVDGEVLQAVANVGVRPTFETRLFSPTVEAHILDFNEDLYGREIRLDFLARLRDEQRFASVQELVTQIELDIREAREYLSINVAIGNDQ